MTAASIIHAIGPLKYERNLRIGFGLTSFISTYFLKKYFSTQTHKNNQINKNYKKYLPLWPNFCKRKVTSSEERPWRGGVVRRDSKASS